MNSLCQSRQSLFVCLKRLTFPALPAPDPGYPSGQFRSTPVPTTWTEDVSPRGCEGLSLENLYAGVAARKYLPPSLPVECPLVARRHSARMRIVAPTHRSL